MSDDFLKPVDRREHVVVDEGLHEVRQRVVRDAGAEHAGQLARVVQIIWVLFAALEMLLGLRVVLKLIGANEANAFANFVYNLSQIFLWPFQSLTASPAAGGMVLEVPTLVAMVVYALAGWLLVRLLWLIFERPRARSVSTYEEH